MRGELSARVGSVSIALNVLDLLLEIFKWILLVRIVIEMIQSFSRNFRPPRWFAVIAEPLFVVTDPPIKALRRLIPPIRMGGVALDLSVLVLVFAIMIVQMILRYLI